MGVNAVSVKPTTTRMRRRSWRRTQRGRAPCPESSPRQCLTGNARDIRHQSTTFPPSQSTQRADSRSLHACVIYQQPQKISIAGAGPPNRCGAPAVTQYLPPCPRVGLTPVTLDATIADASTSLGEASARIQATDLERRETPRVRTAPPGLRVEPKWLPEFPDTPCSAKALTRGVRSPVRVPDPPHPMCNVMAPLCALAVRR